MVLKFSNRKYIELVLPKAFEQYEDAQQFRIRQWYFAHYPLLAVNNLDPKELVSAKLPRRTIDCLYLDRDRVATNVRDQKIKHWDVSCKRCGHITPSPKFASYKMLTNLGE